MNTNLINLLLVIATFLTSVVAIFGEQIRKRMFAPKLEVALENNQGDLNVTNTGVSTRYYHLNVSNKRKSIANNAVVMLTRLDEEKDGKRINMWSGEIPLKWIYHEVYNSLYRNIGTCQKCDLISVDHEYLRIMLMFRTNNLKTAWQGKCSLFLTINVKSDEAESKPITLHINWDGIWDVKKDEMQKHLSISTIDKKLKEKREF